MFLFFKLCIFINVICLISINIFLLNRFCIISNNKIRVNYIVSPCGLHKVTYLGTNSLKSHSRVLTLYFVTFGGINVIYRFKITFY
ncbi:hypothetical protein Hanom_Chr14g01323521 [Helianthus anomalus]